MKFLDSLFGEEEAKEERGEPKGQATVLAKPFKISTSFHPLRLGANSRNSVNLIVHVTNLSPDDQLVSVDVQLPKDQMLGFEPTCLSKASEKRIGSVKSGDTVEAVIPIWANNQTKAGNYGLQLAVYAHYQDYEKVLNYMRKSASLRVV